MIILDTYRRHREKNLGRRFRSLFSKPTIWKSDWVCGQQAEQRDC